MYFFDNLDTKYIKPRSIEHAYLCILEDDILTANAVFETIDSPRGKWGKSITDILLGYTEKFPTYFEIRNFLEIDLNFLLKNEKIDYVEQILGSLEYLILINQETYKYTARVFYENKLYNVCRKYMEKSKNILYNDTELHFMYATYFLNSQEYIEAFEAIQECLKILPDYYPAKKMKEEIKKYIT